MFSSSIQPGLVSIFSSTGSDPLGLWSTHVDKTLLADSFICLLEDTTSSPLPPAPAKLVSPLALQSDPGNESSEGYTIKQTVLHIQSPTLRTTFIQSPPARMNARGLGMKHPWIHLQVRNMDKEWSFEVGIVDRAGREGVIRCTTFQKEPRLKLGVPPLLHLPLSFPPSSSRPLTTWSTINLNLPSLLPHFSSYALAHIDEDEGSDSDKGATTRATVQVPSGAYSHVSYIKVYATCRLRRVWFSDNTPNQEFPWEFQLYSGN